jgi:hypothetical protein
MSNLLINLEYELRSDFHHYLLPQAGEVEPEPLTQDEMMIIRLKCEAFESAHIHEKGEIGNVYVSDWGFPDHHDHWRFEAMIEKQKEMEENGALWGKIRTRNK